MLIPRFLRRFGLPIAALGLVMSVRFVNPALIEDIQLKVFDQFQRMQPRYNDTSPVMIVAIDEESLDKYGQWPWPRRLTGQLLRKLAEAGVGIAAFDFFFAEPDRTSMHTLKKKPDWMGGPRDEKVTESDEALAKAMRDTRMAVIGFSGRVREGGRTPLARTELPAAMFRPLYFPSAVPSLSFLEHAARGVGSVNYLPDRDGVVRRAPLVMQVGDKLLPCLSLEVLAAAHGRRGCYILRAKHKQVRGMQMGKFVIPVEPDGLFWIYYAPGDSRFVIPAWRVLEGHFDSEAFQGTIAFVGPTAAGLGDIVATPLAPSAPGVETHANIVEQIVLKQFLRRTDRTIVFEVFCVFVLGVVLVFLLPWLGPVGRAVACLAGIGAAWSASWVWFKTVGWLVDPIYPTAAALLIFMAATLSPEKGRRRKV